MRRLYGKISNQLVVGLMVIAVLSFGIGGALQYYQSREKLIEAEQVKGTVLNSPRALADFKLTDDRGHIFTNQNLKGQWSFIFFGFTNCGYICPMTMDKLAKVHASLEKQRIKPPQVIFISVDPDRDSVTKIHKYVKAFNPNFIGLRGDKAALKLISDDLSVVYTKIAKGNDNNKENYDINHSGTIMLINPQGDLYAIFSQPHQVKNITQDYTLISQKLAA